MSSDDATPADVILEAVSEIQRAKEMNDFLRYSDALLDEFDIPGFDNLNSVDVYCRDHEEYCERLFGQIGGAVGYRALGGEMKKRLEAVIDKLQWLLSTYPL